MPNHVFQAALGLMKYIAAAVLLGAAGSAVAGELLDQAVGRNQPAHDVPTVEATELDPITVYARGDPFGPNIKGLREAIPCLGCDGQPFRRPKALELGIGAGLFFSRAFFQQTRVRGETNDEAAYYALRMAQCLGDDPICIDRHPASSLYNWEPSAHAADDTILNSANSVYEGQ